MSKSQAATTATAIIWTGIAAISLFAPDLVSGYEQGHIPLALITAWIWGVLASAYIAMLAILADDAVTTWRSLVLATAAVWTAAAVISIFAPELVTGSDPTRVPIAALVAPPAACLGTALVALITAASSRAPSAATATPHLQTATKP